MRLLAILSLLALAFAGCAGSTTTTTTTTTTGTAGMDHAHMMAKTVDVALKGNKFVNETVTVYVGDTVKWINQDAVGHSVTSDAGGKASFDSHPNCQVGVLPAPACMANGQAFSVKFTETGTTKYHCRAHAGMVGTVTVVEHPAM